MEHVEKQLASATELAKPDKSSNKLDEACLAAADKQLANLASLLADQLIQEVLSLDRILAGSAGHEQQVRAAAGGEL